ncbi:hypothetical protein V8F06_013358 [Rhypophila decipiens]
MTADRLLGVAFFRQELFHHAVLYLFSLSGGAALVTAASRGGAKGAVKRAYDGTDTSGGGCEVDNLAGLILGDLQAAIPFCVQYGVKVITETVASTSTRIKVRTGTTTVAPGNERHKARAAEITPAPGVLGRRDEAVNALVHQLEKCPGSAVSVACKGDGNQRVITTTTTVLERTTMTSTKTVTVTGTTFRIYSEFSANRKRSTHGCGDLAPKMYLRQYEPEPNAVYLTADVSTAIVFNWENLNPEFLGALPYYSADTTWPEYNDVTLYSVRTTSGVPWLGYVISISGKNSKEEKLF